MALYTIGDTHLSLGGEKPMDIFEGWGDYVTRLEQNWTRLIKAEDSVVIPGDISWGMSLEEAEEDFKFLESLPGKKILLKGNHDYWWTTMKKMENWLSENEFSSISILSNNSFLYGSVAIAGTRGWLQNDDNAEDKKIFERELGRLRLSLDDAVKKNPDEILVFLHYPPVYSNYTQQPVVDLLREYGIKNCFYGHVHGKSINYAFSGEYDGIRFKLVSADHLQFSPYFILN